MRARRNLPFAAFCVSALLLPSSGTLWGQCAKPSSVPSPAPPRAAVRPVTDKNGSGATILLRTELDALPVEEMTGLPYASKVRSKDEAGRDVPVMHACGHDLHMAAIVGTAAIMARTKDTWHGTLILIGQPAEETISGAKAMVNDGLFTRFPRPDVVVALHVGNTLPAGQVGITPGVYTTNADSLKIRSAPQNEMTPWLGLQLEGLHYAQTGVIEQD
jgi:amidohydrolase